MSKFVGAIAAAVVAFAGLAGTAEAHQHGMTAQAPAPQLAQGKSAASCLQDREACISAGTQTGQYGQRYVPPDVVRQCYDADRACTKQR